jgi:hypothetical protein
VREVNSDLKSDRGGSFEPTKHTRSQSAAGFVSSSGRILKALFGRNCSPSNIYPAGERPCANTANAAIKS